MTNAMITPRIFRFTFGNALDMTQVEAAFVLAIFSVEAIHGTSETRLLAEHAMDAEKREYVVDASTALGHVLSKLFIAFLTRQFGPDSFRVTRIEKTTCGPNCDKGGPGDEK